MPNLLILQIKISLDSNSNYYMGPCVMGWRKMRGSALKWVTSLYNV